MPCNLGGSKCRGPGGLSQQMGFAAVPTADCRYRYPRRTASLTLVASRPFEEYTSVRQVPMGFQHPPPMSASCWAVENHSAKRSPAKYGQNSARGSRCRVLGAPEERPATISSAQQVQVDTCQVQFTLCKTVTPKCVSLATDNQVHLPHAKTQVPNSANT